MKKFTQRFLRDNKGVTAIEYGLIAGLVVLVIAAAVGTLGTNISGVFNAVANKIGNGTTSTGAGPSSGSGSGG
ncbi:Flp family type IVb pilin [Paraburkholderia ginsengisoli]|uniref:Flp family type IVb pilin n=1 Tax=Paraburkholderia ginsengisoli TaxID=311231 RepID=A0A7T4TA49_9BURK|nr:Flp family type IVb pilin [Paraburkholderia ginsengisoli]QQC64940.1 Flp family type IVb pilin [Paraburkholderia ginsengisoli]